jgi:hypothetical protein
MDGNIQTFLTMVETYNSIPAMRFRHDSLGCRRFASQPQSVLGLIPHSTANCRRVFRDFSLKSFIF